MADIANQLQTDREAVLLLYLADELPPQDRAEVERMLSVEPALRHDLDRIRECRQRWRVAWKSSIRPGRCTCPRSTTGGTGDAPVSTGTDLAFAAVGGEQFAVLAEVDLSCIWAAAAIFIAWVVGCGRNRFPVDVGRSNCLQMPHYETDEYSSYRDQVVQERLQRILLASFGAIGSSGRAG
jgi:hypothetical protein